MMRRLRQNGGFTMVEMIVSTVVLSIVMLSTMDLMIANITSVALGKSKAVGLALANERMEYLRDLPYDSLATQHGTIYPAGNIIDDQYITRNNLNFKVHIDIDFVDDPYDGNAAGTIPGKPQDLYPYDYKKAQITVYLKNNNYKVATLTSNIGAKAAETASNTGILNITVMDANGQPVPSATVHITNAAVSPAVDITTTTDNTGLVDIPKLPPDSSHNYQVTASLAGYNSDQTWPDPPGSQTAVNTNPNVLVQQITNVTLGIDRTSTMNFHVTDTGGTAVANQSVTITGSRKKFTNPDVYLYTSTQTTDASGNFTVTNLQWDSYAVAVPSGKVIVTTSPYQLVTLNPNTVLPINLVLSSSNSWPTIKTANPIADSTGTNPESITITGTNFQSGASVTLVKSGQPTITASPVTITGGNTITANFNLTSAALGAWDLVVTNPGGNQAVQTGGFNVTN